MSALCLATSIEAEFAPRVRPSSTTVAGVALMTSPCPSGENGGNGGGGGDGGDGGDGDGGSCDECGGDMGGLCKGSGLDDGGDGHGNCLGNCGGMGGISGGAGAGRMHGNQAASPPANTYVRMACKQPDNPLKLPPTT